MKQITKLFLLTSILLNAGDPCPIHFNFYDAGMPSWLNQSSVLNKLENKDFWLGIGHAYKLQDNHMLSMQITKVFKNSPADIAGLQVGDIILKIDNLPLSVENKERFFDDILKKKHLNDVVTFTILRDKKEKKISLVLDKMRDPLIRNLKRQLIDDRKKEDGTEPCTTVENFILKKEEIKKVHAKVFLKNKSFDCKNAHKKISTLNLVKQYSEGNVFVIRGSRRILFAHLGWKSMCVNYNGNLTQTQRRKVLSTLFDDYIKDRHLNP